MDYCSFGFSESSVIRLLKKTPAILGCLLLLCSILFPFYCFVPSIVVEDRFLVYYWSFKSSTQFFASYGFFLIRAPDRVVDHWFCEYWFPYGVVNRDSWILIPMFMAQIVALATGMITIFVNRKEIALFPVIICPIVAMLMMSPSITQYSDKASSYQLAYWLNYSSIILFVVNLALTVLKKRRV